MGHEKDWRKGKCPTFLCADPKAKDMADTMETMLEKMCENQNPSFVELQGVHLSDEQWAEAFRLLFARLEWEHKPAYVTDPRCGMLMFGLGRARGPHWHLIDPSNPAMTIKNVRESSRRNMT